MGAHIITTTVKTKYRHRPGRVYFMNKWRSENRFSRGDMTFIGINRWFCSPFEYRIALCFFGLEVHFWFIRKPIGPVEYKIDTKPNVLE